MGILKHILTKQNKDTITQDNTLRFIKKERLTTATPPCNTNAWT